MENSITNEEISYKDIDEYKNDIISTIENILITYDNLVFANVAKKSGVNEFVIRKFPQLRMFILQEILKYKKKHVINSRIEKVVNSLIKSKKNISFVTVLNKCKFTSEYDEERDYINRRIRELVIQNTYRFKI